MVPKETPMKVIEILRDVIVVMGEVLFCFLEKVVDGTKTYFVIGIGDHEREIPGPEESASQERQKMRIRSYSGAGVMLFRYDSRQECFEVLLGKRATRRGYGQWAIIGGEKNHADGDFLDCALREFREENGVDLRRIRTKTLAVRRIDVPYYHWRTFLILTWGHFPEFEMNDENSELKWFPISAVSRQDLWISLDRELRIFKRLIRGNPPQFPMHEEDA